MTLMRTTAGITTDLPSSFWPAYAETAWTAMNPQALLAEQLGEPRNKLLAQLTADI